MDEWLPPMDSAHIKTYTPLYIVCTFMLKALIHIYIDLSLTHAQIDIGFTIYSTNKGIIIFYATSYHHQLLTIAAYYPLNKFLHNHQTIYLFA